MNGIKIMALLVVAGSATAYIAWKLLSKNPKKDSRSGAFEMPAERINKDCKETSTSGDSNNEVVSFSDIKKQFEVHAKRFEGNYEPLYRAVQENNAEAIRGILANWDRIIRRIDSPEISGVWGNLMDNYCGGNKQVCQEMAPKWLEVIQSYGIKRKEEKRIKFDDDTGLYYEISAPYEKGDWGKVQRPCWVLQDNGIVVEKGVVVPE